MLTPPTIADLEAFTGQTGYTAFATQALAQSTLLFSVLSGLDEYPTEPDRKQLAMYAIMEMAERLYREQPYVSIMAAPFQSETIGSYSYSKGSAFAVAQRGGRTGLLWWDLALEQLGDADNSKVTFSSIHLINEIYNDGSGQRYILSPGDVAPRSGSYDVNAEVRPRDPN